MRKPAVKRSALFLAAAMMTAIGLPAMAQSSLTVDIDRTQRIQLRGAASSVIVANPAVADVTVVDSSTLFVLGRAYGSTEMVVVDAIGRTLYQTVITVGAPQSGHVRVWRGTQPVEMTCAANCSPSARQLAGPDGTP